MGDADGDGQISLAEFERLGELLRGNDQLKAELGVGQPPLSCGISLVLLGGSISVDLTSSIHAIQEMGIQVDHQSIHSTLLWRRGGFSSRDLASCVAFRKKWLSERGRPPRTAHGGSCTFDISQQWGKGSNYIHGELLEFIEEARAVLAPQLQCDLQSQRPPHASLRMH
jgi:hypothetical protein